MEKREIETKKGDGLFFFRTFYLKSTKNSIPISLVAVLKWLLKCTSRSVLGCPSK